MRSAGTALSKRSLCSRERAWGRTAIELLESRTLLSGVPLPATHAAAPSGSVSAPVLHTADAALGWFDPGWSYRRVITIDHTKVSGGSDLSNFPVLIDTGSDSELAAHAMTNGNDIVFAAADGITQLAHEIDSYNASTGRLQAWVNVPTLSVTTDTTLYLYYGNATAPNEQNAAGVWSASSAAVYHLGQSADPYLDSTANANNSISASIDPTSTAGEFGVAQQFNGLSNTIVIPNAPVLNPTTNATVSAWARLDARGQTDIVEKGGTGGYALWQSDDTMWFGSQYATVQGWAVGLTHLQLGVWYEFDGVSSNGVKSIYVNGVLDGTSTVSDSFSNIGALQIGNGIDGHFSGAIDEVRIENMAHSAGWISTKYSNQSSPGTFSSVGVETVPNHSPVGTDNTITTPEDATYTFGAGDFGFTDPNDTAANAFSAVKIATIPAAGLLTLSGTPVSAGQFISVVDLSAGHLQYMPGTNMNGAGYTSLTFEVQDDGSAAGGFNLDATPRTLTFNITPVNDAPVLTGANPFATIAEDQTSNAGDLVSTLIAGQVSDIDAGAVSGIAVTGLVNGNGSWQFSVNGGTNWRAVGAVAANHALLLRGTDSLRFVPGGLGATHASVLYHAWDQTSGSAGAYADESNHGGNSAFSSNAGISAIAVSAVDHPPAAANLSADEQYRENAPLALKPIVVTDIDSRAVTATLTLSDPAAGSLDTGSSNGVTSTFNALTGTWSVTGAVADVNTLLAHLTFTPATNYSSDFTISTSISDGAAPAIAGIKHIHGIAQRPIPIANDDSFTMNQDDTLSVPAAGILGNDTAVAGGSLSAHLIAQPSSGTLTLNTDGSFVYVPNAGFSGRDTFTYSANDGVADSPTATVTINVTAVIPPPVLSDIETRPVGYNAAPAGVDLTDSLAVRRNGLLTGATAQITGNYAAATDSLSLHGITGITASWDATTGTLALQGADTPAHYQAALRAVMFNYTAEGSLGATRTVSFTVTRGSLNSNVLTRDIYDSRPGVLPLQATIDAFITRRTQANIGPNQLRLLQWAQARLTSYFGTSRPVGTITSADAAQFRASAGSIVKPQYSAKLLKITQRFFEAAVGKKIVYRSPFAKKK